MTISELHAIFDSTPRLSPKQRAFAFRDGLRILFDLIDESDWVSVQHDILYYGSPDDVVDKITVGQAMQLAGLGWFIREDSFAFYT